MWIWRKMEGVSWEDRITNEEMLKRVGEERSILDVIKKRKKNWIGHNVRHDTSLRAAMEGMLKGKRES